jgi:hypothetical protein
MKTAIHDPPQPFRIRILAGFLDFMLAFMSFGLLTGDYHVGSWPVVPNLILILAYFVILGCTGGTIFQRLFRMMRAKATAQRTEE